MNPNHLKHKYLNALEQDMVFKSEEVAKKFLIDLIDYLPQLEFNPPQNEDEILRAIDRDEDGGETIILHKNLTMSAGDGEVLPVFICQDFCNLIEKYSVWDIVDDSLKNKI